MIMGTKEKDRLICIASLCILIAAWGCNATRLAGNPDADASLPDQGQDQAMPDLGDTSDTSPDTTTDLWPDDVFDTLPPDVVAPDTVYDYTYDAELDWPSSDSGPTELPPLPYVDQCGNGVLDEGEECDDRNRLNGDGCDWLCRIGDGDPPPEPEPDVDPYVPEGDLIYLPDLTDTAGFSPERLPIQWTGSEFATAFVEWHEDDSRNIRFRRFDEHGEPFDADWVYWPGPWLDGSTDLVWTGSGFGLFFADLTYGIYYMRLSPDGKPLSDPVIVEPDPSARGVAADLTDSGFVLTWITEANPDVIWSWCSDVDGPYDTIRLRLVDFDGTTYGPPLMVEDMAGGPPDVSTGDGGFGLTMMVGISREYPACALRFVRVDETLTNVVYSGILSDGSYGDVAWIEGHYMVGWSYMESVEGVNSEICIASFSAAGNLERAPTCNNVTPPVMEGVYATHMAAGDNGLALVFVSDADQQMHYLRTGLNGRAVMPPVSVVGSMCEPYLTFCYFGSFGTTWADQGFAVLFIGNFEGIEGLFLRHFVSAG